MPAPSSVLGSAHKHGRTQRDAAAPPLPPALLPRLSLVLLSSLSCSIGILFPVLLLSTDFPWLSLRKASNPKDNPAETVETGAKVVETEAKQASSWKEPYGTSRRRGGKTTRHDGGQEGWQGRQPRRVACLCSRGPGQTRRNIPTCSAWLESPGLVATFSSYQSTILPLFLQSPTF